MLLDNRTLLISLMLISALMALSLSIVSRQAKRDGLSKWAGALALESLVWLLVAARGAIPDFYSILIANVLMAVAQAMKLAAIHEYRKQDFPYVQCLLPVALTLIVFLLLPYEDVRSRFVFSSSIFILYLLPAFLLIYYLLPGKFKNYFTLLASILFYSWGAPRFIFVILGTTFLDFHLVQWMAATRTKLHRRLMLSLSVSVNLGLLFYFKYSNFFIENVNAVLSLFGMTGVHWTKLVLPI